MVQYKYKPEYLDNFPEEERHKMTSYQTGVLAQVPGRNQPLHGTPLAEISNKKFPEEKKQTLVFARNQMENFFAQIKKFKF